MSTATEPELAGPRSLVTDLSAAMLNAREVSKNSRNKDQNYDYASIESILAAIRVPLLERSIVVNAKTVDMELTPVTSKQGTQGTKAIVTVDFEFLHGPTGDKLVSSGWRGEGVDYGDKAISKAYTSVGKSFIKLEWLLPTDGDRHPDLPEAVAGAQQPAWAAAARPERQQELAANLTALGVDPDVLLGSIEDSIGHVPDVLVAFTRAITLNSSSPQPAAEGPTSPEAAGDGDDVPTVHPDQDSLPVG